MTPLSRNRILVGDVRERLRELPDASVDCVITSPPYFQLRDFGMAGQLGLEPTVGDWVEELRVVLGGLVRVLKPTGSLWLNLGDTYSRHHRSGAPPKSLVLAPERLLLALAADGWIVRNKLIWAKTNPMPSSVADRLSGTYDVVYLLVRSGRYYFDLDAIRLPHRSHRTDRRSAAAVYPPPGIGAPAWDSDRGNQGLAALHARGLVGHRLGKNPGDVWQIPAANYRGAHFATFPPALVERPLLAGCPERVCCRCGCPYKREGQVLRSQLGVSQPRRAPRDVHRFKHHYRVIRTRGHAPARLQLPGGKPTRTGARPVLWGRHGRSRRRPARPRLDRHRTQPGLRPARARADRQRAEDRNDASLKRAASGMNDVLGLDGPPVDGTLTRFCPPHSHPSPLERRHEP